MEQSGTDKLKEALGALPKTFDLLSKGEQAQLRRLKAPERLREQEAFFRLCAQSSLIKSGLAQMERVIFFLPWLAPHSALKLGGALERGRVDERRLFQVLRSESPNDLIYLRRLIQMAASRQKMKRLSINWEDASLKFFYWGEHNKRDILQDYYRKRHFEEMDSNDSNDQE